MAKNMIYKDANVLEIAVPAGITSGDPVVVNNLTGVALTDRDATSGKATVKFNAVFDLSVKAIDDDGDSAVAIGDIIFWLTGDTPKLSKKNSGTAYGVALETITEGETDTIMVMLMDIAALASIPANMITNAMMADDAIDSAEIEDGAVDKVHLAADIVDGTKIEDAAVDSEHIADGAVDLAHLNANQKVRLIALTIGALTTTTTFCVHVALKACEVKSVTFINKNAVAAHADDHWTMEIINKGIDGSGSDVVATQNSDADDGNQAFEAYKKWPLVVAVDGKEDIVADSVLVFVATLGGSGAALAESVIVLELEVQDPA